MTFAAGLAFWTAIAALAYTFVGYRVLIRLLAGRGAAAPASGVLSADPPDICAVVVAHNEEDRIAGRVLNLLAAEYPPERLRVLVVSDGSTDETVMKVEELRDARARVLALPERRGKAAGVNAAVHTAAAEVVVFTDARQQFDPDAISRLAAHFADARTGAVSGSLEIHGARSNTGRGIDAYWRFEKAIRLDESQWDSCIGCTGAIYAIRRALFEPLREDTVLDDVVIPMQIAMKGFRVRHDDGAVAFDPQPLEPAAERLRKQRTLAGNFQMLFRYPEWLIPGGSRLWWQLLSPQISPPLIAALVGHGARGERRPFCASLFIA